VRLTASVLLLLAGCGGGGEATNPAPAATPVVETPVVQAASPLQFHTEGWTEPTTIIVPSQAWEFTANSLRGSVLEPSVLYDSSSGIYTMWYSGGCDKCATGTATSVDGVNWTKNPANPVIGQGALGHPTACRNSVVRVNGEVYVYFANSTGATSGSIYVTHSADGVTNLAAPVPLLAPGTADTNLANSWPVMLPDGKMRFFYDSLTASGTWEVFSALCAGPLGPCVKDAGPLKSMQTGAGAYGGGSARLVGGRFDTYYLAGPNGAEKGHVPTYIYHTCDAMAATASFGNGGNPLFQLPAGFDQHGDPFAVDGPDGNARLYFDAVDNPSGYAHIVMASRQGSLASVSCP
jgi:hypothetical protein